MQLNKLFFPFVVMAKTRGGKQYVVRRQCADTNVITHIPHTEESRLSSNSLVRVTRNSLSRTFISSKKLSRSLLTAQMHNKTQIKKTSVSLRKKRTSYSSAENSINGAQINISSQLLANSIKQCAKKVIGNKPNSLSVNEQSKPSPASDETSVIKKRGKTRLWNEQNMTAAYDAVKAGLLSVRRAAKQYEVPRTTLRDRLDGRVDLNAKPGRKALLSDTEEKKLIDYASYRAQLGIGFGKNSFLKYAANLAKKYRKPFKNSYPSNRWWQALQKRHKKKISLRQPEGTASVRHQCMDSVKVQKYFSCLKEVLSTVNGPTQIWNMDETGLQLDVKPRKIVAATGTKYLHSRTSGNRETLTVIACINADGTAIPPHITIKGKTKKSLLGFTTDVAPQGTKWSWSDSGWTKQGLAQLWFTDTFLPSIGIERPQVLILDGHDSHNFLELVDLAIANGIHMVELPAHTSNWLQPCDRTVFNSLKEFYRAAAQDMMSQFPGVVTSRSNFTAIFATAWTKAMTKKNICAGFRASGIWPFDPSAIPAEAYLPNVLHIVDQAAGQMVETGENIIPLHEQRASIVNSQKQGEHDVYTVLPSDALLLMEAQLTKEQLTSYNYLSSNGFNLQMDKQFSD